MRAKIILGLLALAFLAYFFLKPSDEKQIMQLMDELEELSSFEQQLPLFERLARVQHILSLLVEDVKISAMLEDGEERSIQGKAKLKDKLLAAAQYLGKVASVCEDRKLEIKEDETARLQCQVRVLGQEQGRSDLFQEVRHAQILLRKIEGDWKIFEASELHP